VIRVLQAPGNHAFVLCEGRGDGELNMEKEQSVVCARAISRIVGRFVRFSPRFVRWVVGSRGEKVLGNGKGFGSVAEPLLFPVVVTGAGDRVHGVCECDVGVWVS